MRIAALVAIALALASPGALRAPEASAGKAVGFWDQPRRGANLFNRRETAGRLGAAAAAGLSFVRLTPSKWRGAGRDFLVGDADRFEELPAGDLRQLRQTLDAAHAARLKVVLTLLTLPGARWRQHNGNRSDFRLWSDPRYQAQAADFWARLATALRGHPAIAAYNPLNEPHPELRDGGLDEAAFDAAAHARRVAGTPADLDRFYRLVVSRIREADPAVPIVLDCGLYASPRACAALAPIADPGVLYSFHMYDPYVFTTARQNRGRYGYPGPIAGATWDRAAIDRALEPVAAWQRRHGLPDSRVLAGEFGCDRRVRGAAAYLADVVAAIEVRGWHWAFYAYREDTWDGMDYELGSAPTPPGYWEAVEAGREPVVTRGPNPLWDVLAGALRRPPSPGGGARR